MYTSRVRLATVQHILATCPPCLRQVNLDLTLHRTQAGNFEDAAITRNIRGDECAQLEGVILQKHKKLEKLVFDLRDRMDPYVLPQDVWNTVQESMPRLKESGVTVLHPRLHTRKEVD